ncbi:hypothetical protein C5167_044563 [Papaver somniferum]|uniref:DNA topoisomerase 2 n=1 Tax=Papaver somniferum TaxID=3469 RepID=A0A4Y7LCR4_PAPSO|nr:DNA topoisomerase 2-like [Papaver somniferum]RZC81985.1 hypothetical protein C5167_044563 [Papaver somniferum]
MTIDKTLPLQTSTNNTNVPKNPASKNQKGKTIEEMYQKKSQLEHILLRPDTYIGSIEKHTQSLWVFEEGQMVYRPVSYVPGLYKIFDEILVNAADNKQRDPKMALVRVNIDVEGNTISVYNDGDGVPVEIHQEEGIYVPEMIFGHLLTSSNYDDAEKKTTGGRNGYGAKLANIFSTEFTIETADGKRKKQYKQVFSNNMGTKSEPIITKCKASDNWTKVTFKPDLAKFNMTHLEADVVALMKKRVIDIAGCIGKTVKVELNGDKIPIKSFGDYVKLYMDSAAKNRGQAPSSYVEKVNDRWEVCVSLSEGQFQQVSFVNGIATIKGGTHVDYVASQVSSHIMNLVNKKNKNANLKPHTVKNHLWIFVNALIDNPAFDSQTKETLTTRQGSFGTKCELSQEFLKKVAKSGVVENLLSWADFKASKDLKKTDGSKKERVTGILKLEDANEAGKPASHKCTLILTEGDSAKALAMAGISVVGRNHYGVFPLRGKLLNVREASAKQIQDNAEIQSIKKILGLKQGDVYENVQKLRYGHLMIMTDQDHDGSHIKGLLINFIHSFWPSLLKIPSFLVEFITPIVKVTHRKNKNVISFYSMPEYETWLESLGGSSKGWDVKYYKGLGTSTSKEGKEYFSDLGKHKKDFVWVDEQDGEAIEMAFSKKKIEARKSWLKQYEPGTFLDQKEQYIKYSDFVNKELIQFSIADLQRSIPAMVDGLKPGQRKILFCCFKRNFTKEAKVAQFSGYVSEHSAYHHGEASLAGTIIGMAQDFVGSNNINLLQPNGQFGTRHQGGKDHASARYVYTCLSPITRFLFPKEDDILLDYLNEDGQFIEPTWYVPIMPTVLVNGSEGIGTGWSTFIPNYNPRDIVANVKRLINGEPMVPMDPWYKGFKGTIEKTASKEGGYTVTGVIEEVNETTLRVSELPVRRWTQDYKEFLESMMTGNDKVKEAFIKDYREHNDDTTVHFEVVLSEENMMIAKQEGILKKFKLSNSLSTNNMHLFGPDGVIKKYDNPEQIIEDFFGIRLELYKKRKRVLLENLEYDLNQLDNKVRFILGVVKGEIIVSNRKRVELYLELQQKGFDLIPPKAKNGAATSKPEDAEENENDNNSELPSDEGLLARGYAYLLTMAIGSLTLEKVQELCKEKEKLDGEVLELKNATEKSLWLKDLEAFEKKLDEQDVRDIKAEEERKVMKSKVMKDAGMNAGKQAPKNPRKYTKKASTSTSVAAPPNSAMEIDDASEVPKPKGRGGPKKAPAKAKPAASVDTDEEDDIPSLTDRLAASNLDSSPDKDTENHAAPAKKKPVAKRASAAQKKTTTVISTDEEPMKTISEEGSDDEFEPPAAVPAGRKKALAKPAASKAAAKPAAAPRKRGQAKKQTLITDTLKPAENVGISPEKKVRRIRQSPFNKKSSSIMGRIGEGSSSGEKSLSVSEEQLESSNEVVAPIRRPVRASRNVTKYVVSDSDEAADDKSDSDAAVDISSEDDD